MLISSYMCAKYKYKIHERWGVKTFYITPVDISVINYKAVDNS
jgi:hypothetical protein